MTQSTEEKERIEELTRLVSVFNRLSLTLVIGAMVAIIAMAFIIAVIALPGI